MIIRVFVVEDELLHLEAIKITVEEAGFINCGECTNADLAFEAIKKAMPDVVLLDIGLPGFNNGISVANRIKKELNIPHIFTTSFTQDEVVDQAVATQPAGYLHKPVDLVHLKAAIQIAVNTYSGKAHPEEVPSHQLPVFTRIGDKLVRINIDEIVIIKADGENYISLVTEKKEISCRATLKEVSKQLPPSFIQVHRSFIINLDHLESFNERMQTAVLKGRTAPVARNFRKHFLSSIQQI